METILEEEASFYKPSGSIYIRIPATYTKFIDIEVNANNEIISDCKIAMGRGKHGNFVFIYSPRQQRKYQKDKPKDLEE